MNKLQEIDTAIRRYYEKRAVLSADLIESILYSIDAGGKRIRPLIMLEILEGFGIDLTDSHFDVAASIEMIHTGSLIHDDLPAMDDDDYRRGRLTNHKKFDEATAVLAGDSLFLDPFGLIAETNLSAEIKVDLISELSFASGSYGMVGGQILDMKGEGADLTLKALQTIHANKTGKLLTFPFVAAGLMAEQDREQVAALRQVGELLGLSFQVRDDILDVTASFEDIGKTPQKDLVADKSTYPALLGIGKSYEILNEALDTASAFFQKLQENQGFKPDRMLEIIERLRLHG